MCGGEGLCSHTELGSHPSPALPLTSCLIPGWSLHFPLNGDQSLLGRFFNDSAQHNSLKVTQSEVELGFESQHTGHHQPLLPSCPPLTRPSLLSPTYAPLSPLSRGSIHPSTHPVISHSSSTCARPAEHTPAQVTAPTMVATVVAEALPHACQSGWKIDRHTGDDNPL